jgi:glycosyltransferase involved in cell wall biosynthesis
VSDRRPKVTVCIPAHNSAQYLPGAIDSVLTQEFADFELVVSDDASDDETPEIGKRYADPRFRVERSDSRLGQAGNWNRCVELARGKYVILLHADDQLLPGYLQRAVATLDANPDVGLVHCAVQHVDEINRALHLQRLAAEDRIDRDDATLRRLLLDGCVINPAGVMVRRGVYETVGRFTDQIIWGVDWHMWIRIALRWPLVYLADPLALYREHHQSGTSAVMSSGRNARDEEWLFEDVFGLIRNIRPDLSELEPAAMRGIAHRTWCFAEEACERGDTRAARAGLRNAVRIWPRMSLKPQVLGLWAATYTGYRWFALARDGRRSMAKRLGRARSAG